MERRKILFHQAVNQNHINRRGGCKKGNLVGRQIVEGSDIEKIHPSELDAPIPIIPTAWLRGAFRTKGRKTANEPAMRASATKLAGSPDRQFPSSPNDNAQMKDVSSNAGMRAEAYGERKTKSIPTAQSI